MVFECLIIWPTNKYSWFVCLKFQLISIIFVDLGVYGFGAPINLASWSENSADQNV
jgi:hypothetical protein